METVTTAQAVYYYTHYWKDPWPFKVVVAWVVLLDLFHQICIEHNGKLSFTSVFSLVLKPCFIVKGYMYEIANWDVRIDT